MAVISLDACAALAKTCRARGQTVVVTAGVFDLLHLGHTRHLAAASAEGDVLIVCVRTDQSCGGERADGPMTPEAERAELVAALAAVDAVVIVDDEMFEAVVERLRPDVLVVSAEAGATDGHGRAAIEQLGGRAVLAPVTPEWSTADLLANVRRGA